MLLLPRLAASLALLAIALPAAAARADNLISPGELAEIRALADQGIAPHAAQRTALEQAAARDWRWGSVSGEFVTTRSGTTKYCHPASDPTQVDYLKEGAPDAYARILAYRTMKSPAQAFAADARARVLDLVDTWGFRGLSGEDWSASNQCILELAISLPVWIETAQLLAGTPVWSEADRSAFGDWLARVAYPRVAWASRVRRNNWGAAGSAAAALIADYVDGLVTTLDEPWWSPARSLAPAQARTEHEAQQLARIGTSWRGDSDCPRVGIQSHGGIPDELRRGSAGCDATFLPQGDDSALTYQTMHVELLVLHAEAARRQGRSALFEARTPSGAPAILQSILFVIANGSPGGLSWPWGPRTGALAVAHRYYQDDRLAQELANSESPTARGGRTLPYAKLATPPPEPPSSVSVR